MDIEATLAELRALVQKQRMLDGMSLTPHQVERFAELWYALDCWVSQGGGMPREWRMAWQVPAPAPVDDTAQAWVTDHGWTAANALAGHSESMALMADGARQAVAEGTASRRMLQSARAYDEAADRAATARRALSLLLDLDDGAGAAGSTPLFEEVEVSAGVYRTPADSREVTAAWSEGAVTTGELAGHYVLLIDAAAPWARSIEDLAATLDGPDLLDFVIGREIEHGDWHTMRDAVVHMADRVLARKHGKEEA
jgi:hypothetical protein